MHHSDIPYCLLQSKNEKLSLANCQNTVIWKQIMFQFLEKTNDWYKQLNVMVKTRIKSQLSLEMGIDTYSKFVFSEEVH